MVDSSFLDDDAKDIEIAVYLCMRAAEARHAA